MLYKSKDYDDYEERIAAYKCPNCNGKLIERNQKSTGQIFLGCSNFPNCDFTCKYEEPYRMDNLANYEKKIVYYICPKCNNELISKESPTDGHTYLSCKNTNCDFTFSYEKRREFLHLLHDHNKK